jgi:hypothetical protein
MQERLHGRINTVRDAAAAAAAGADFVPSPAGNANSLQVCYPTCLFFVASQQTHHQPQQQPATVEAANVPANHS